MEIHAFIALGSAFHAVNEISPSGHSAYGRHPSTVIPCFCADKHLFLLSASLLFVFFVPSMTVRYGLLVPLRWYFPSFLSFSGLVFFSVPFLPWSFLWATARAVFWIL